MIDAKDLMVGNFVKSNNPQHRPNELGKFLYVTKVDSDSDSIGCFVYEDLPFVINFGQYTKFIDGIELTEDILVKCGFIYFKHNNSYQLDTTFGFSFWGRLGHGFNCYCEREEFGITFNYLHELQNLYKALTKQNLQINL